RRVSPIRRLTSTSVSSAAEGRSLRSASALKACRSDARCPGSVVHQRQVVATGPVEQNLHLAMLPEAELHQEPTTRLEEPGSVRDDALVDGETVGSAVECLARLTLEENRPIAFEAAGRDVRRIADDDIDAAFE